MEGKLGYMMIETSIIQVLLIHLHSLFYKEEAFKQPVANRRDFEIIQQLKDYLTKTFPGRSLPHDTCKTVRYQHK